MEISNDLTIRGDAYIDGLRGSGDRNVGVTSDGKLKILDVAESVNVQILTTNITLTPDSATRQILSPLGASRIVNLPTTNVPVGKRFVIYNNSSVNDNLSIIVQQVMYNNLQSAYSIAAQHSIETIWDGLYWRVNFNSNATVGSAQNNKNTISVGTSQSATNSIVIGECTTINNSISIGRGNSSIGSYSTVLGNNNINAPGRNVLIGHTQSQINNGAIAIGHDAYNVNNEAIAIGLHNRATGYRAVAIGTPSVAHRAHEIASNAYNSTVVEGFSWQNGVKIQKYERYVISSSVPINTWVDIPITGNTHLYIYARSVYNFQYFIDAMYQQGSSGAFSAQAWNIRGCVASHGYATNRLYFLPINNQNYIIETYGSAGLEARLVLDQNEGTMKLQIRKTQQITENDIMIGAIAIACEMLHYYY